MSGGITLARVTDLHPEELLDKEAAQTLSPEERVRLEAHLVRCADCRWEREARRAFELESLETDEALAGALQRLTEQAPHVSGQRAIQERSAQERSAQELAAQPLAAQQEEPFLREVTAPHLSEQRAAQQEEPRQLRAPGARRRPSRRSHFAVSLLLVSGTAAAWVGFAPTPPSTTTPHSIIQIGDRGLGTAPPGAVEDPSAEPPATGATSPSPASSAPSTMPAAAMARAPAQRTLVKRSAPPVPSAASLPSPASLSAAERFAAGNRARGRGDLAVASQHYTALVKEHPGTPEARAARALLAQLALDEGLPARALAHYDAYLGAGEERPVLSEEALIGRARALSQLGQAKEAARAWRELLKHYPDSAARAEAQRHLTP